MNAEMKETNNRRGRSSNLWILPSCEWKKFGAVGRGKAGGIAEPSNEPEVDDDVQHRAT